MLSRGASVVDLLGMEQPTSTSADGSNQANSTQNEAAPAASAKIEALDLDAETVEAIKSTFMDYQGAETFLQFPCVFRRAHRLYYWDTKARPPLSATIHC